jgi:Nup53/35/40-type RNA recognition motif
MYPPLQPTNAAPSPQPDAPSLFAGQPPASSPKRADPTPVILFGFPSSHSLLIIREYERYGPILEHFSSVHATLPSNVPTPPREIVHGGNWIRITYADAVSAARAVGTNGQLIGGAYMIGVIYAPKAAADAPTAEEVEPRREEGVTRSGTAGERKMNVVRGGNMFVKQGQQEQVGWRTWVWNSVFGAGEKKGDVGVVVGGQANPAVTVIKGLSETIFGF